MKDRTDAWHFFGRSCVEFLDFAVGDRRLNGHGV